MARARVVCRNWFVGNLMSTTTNDQRTTRRRKPPNITRMNLLCCRVLPGVAGSRFGNAGNRATRCRGIFAGQRATALPGCTTQVLVTDHHPIVDTAKRGGYARTYQYNWLFEKIKRTFPHLNVEVNFVAGESNPADEVSRGRPSDPRKWEAALAHARSSLAYCCFESLRWEFATLLAVRSQ